MNQKNRGLIWIGIGCILLPEIVLPLIVAIGAGATAYGLAGGK